MYPFIVFILSAVGIVGVETFILFGILNAYIVYTVSLGLSISPPKNAKINYCKFDIEKLPSPFGCNITPYGKFDGLLLFTVPLLLLV